MFQNTIRAESNSIPSKGTKTQLLVDQLRKILYADDDADVEREVAGLRAVGGPRRADALAVPGDQRPEGEEGDRDDDLPGAMRAHGPALLLLHAIPRVARKRAPGGRPEPDSGPRVTSPRGSRLPS